MKKRFLLILLILVSICSQGQAQAPANDECFTSTYLSPASTCFTTSGTLFGATQSLTANCSGADANEDVWYTFIPTTPSVNIKASTATSLDLVIELFTGCGTGFVKCQNAAGGGATETLLASGLTGGNVYYFRIYEASSATVNAAAVFDVCVMESNVPVNDECSNATSLLMSSTCNPTSGTLFGATQSLAANCSGADANEDVWYSFTATSAIASIDASTATSLDLVIELFTGCGTGFVKCQNSSGAGDSETLFASGLTNGSTYYFRVYESGSATVNAAAVFNVCVTESNFPANDECSNATSLLMSSTCNTTSGTLFGATQSLAANCSGADANEDVWYSFTATTASASIDASTATSIDLVIELFTGCGTGYVSCKNNGGVGAAEALTAYGLVPGSTYYFRIYESGSFSVNANAVFDVCVVESSVTGTTSPLHQDEVVVFPNPSLDGSVKVSVEFDKVVLTNALGQTEEYYNNSDITTKMKGLVLIQIRHKEKVISSKVYFE